VQIIAEVKTKSPFGWHSNKSWDELFQIAEEVGDMISIHTDPRWGGSFELLARAVSLTKKPVLAKGIHSDDADVVRALDMGAARVLVVSNRVIRADLLDSCLVEPATIEDLKRLSPDIKAVWNSRDLGTGGLKAESFSAARAAFGGWLCQASNITKLADIHPEANAVLIGEHLPAIANEMRYQG
jgi:indole-3-glycerol phosphate synthase